MIINNYSLRMANPRKFCPSKFLVPYGNASGMQYSKRMYMKTLVPVACVPTEYSLLSSLPLLVLVHIALAMSLTHVQMLLPQDIHVRVGRLGWVRGMVGMGWAGLGGRVL